MKHLDISHAHDKKPDLSSTVSFQKTRKINNSLVRPKLYPCERIGDSFKCKKNKCQVCLNVNDADVFGSTGWTYKEKLT